MKLLALAACAISTLVICPPSEARSIQAYESHNLNNVIINGEQTDLSGRVTINYVENKIQVEIAKDICGHYKDLPAGTMRCMAMPIPQATFSVPLQSRVNDGCGSLLISGAEDLRRADGFRTEITVKNNTHRVCDDVIRSLVEVSARTISPLGTTTVYDLTK